MAAKDKIVICKNCGMPMHECAGCMICKNCLGAYVIGDDIGTKTATGKWINTKDVKKKLVKLFDKMMQEIEDGVINERIEQLDK